VSTRVFAAACAAAFSLFSVLPFATLAASAAEAYPKQAIRLVVPFPPGGPTDIVARPLAQALSHQLGQQVVVDNRGGAGGIIGADLVAKSPADGYTLLLGTVGTNAINQSLYRKLPYQPSTDFTPISLLASAPVVLAVNPSVPAHTLAEFIALARSKPKSIAYGSAGSGSPGHLAGALFADAVHAELLHVPYKGSAPAISDLLSGQIPAMFDPVQSPLANIRAGKLRALAVSGTRRSPVLPDVPTMAEAGVPGYEAEAWWALFAPAGLPAAVQQKLQAETARIMRSAEMREQLGKLGIEPVGSSAAELRALVETEVPKWARAVKSSGATVD